MVVHTARLLTALLTVVAISSANGQPLPAVGGARTRTEARSSTVERLPEPPHPATTTPAAKPSAEAQRHAEILLRAARNSVALGNLSEALARFEKLLRIAPRNYGARFEYAGLLLQVGRTSDGLRQLEQLVAEQGEVGAYRMALANLLLQLKEYGAARQQFQTLLTDSTLRQQATIGIAQALVLERRLDEARKFYDERVADLRGMDRAATVALAQLLIDMQRPAEAVNLLRPLHELDPSDEAVIAPLVLALVRTNDRIHALKLIDELRNRPPDNPGRWIALAERLYDEQALAESLALLQELWARWPQNQRVRLDLARTHLRLYEVEQAKQLLTNCSDDDDRDSLYWTVLIDYHTLVGDYAEAIDLAKQRLRANRRDIEAVILLADAYHASQQFALAEATYATALAECPPIDEELRRKILRLQAKNYLLSRQYRQAVSVLGSLVEQRPADVGSRILLVETLTKMGCYDAAKKVATASLKGENPRDRFALQTRLGYVLIEQRCWAAAMDQFLQLAEMSDQPPPEVAYGLYLAARMLNQSQVMSYAYGLGPSPLAPDPYWSTVFASLAMAYCDCQTASAVLDQAIQGSPCNVVLLNQRGEASQLCDCRCDANGILNQRRDGCGDEAACCPNPWFLGALQVSPTNIRARLGLARSLERHMAYEAAEEQYRILVKQMPHDANLTREVAQMVAGNDGLKRARKLYTSRPPAEPIEDDLDDEGAFDDVDPTDVPNSAFTGEPEPLIFDQFLSSEFQATSVRGWHLYETIGRYQRLIEREPWNDSAMFGLAQAQSALGRTHCAMETYRRLLAENPCHEEAATALLRCEMELHPKVISVVDYENQFGRQGLANMTWLNVSMAVRHSLGDEDEFFEWGYRERLLQPTDDRADFGQIPFFRWQEKYAADLLMFVEVAVENYQYGLQTRPTFRAGLDLLSTDEFDLSLTGYLENYYVCGEAIRQDIYTTGIQVDAVYRPRRLWTLGGFYRIANLSDNNWVNWLNFNSAIVLIEGRKQLRALVDVDFYGFAQQTIFGPAYPPSLVGTIHPYWSPSAYVFPTMGLDWKHWLSRDRFKGANEHFYSVFVGGVVDSNGVPFFVANGRWQRDLSESLSWTIDFNLIRSPNQVYDAAGAMAYGVWRR